MASVIEASRALADQIEGPMRIAEARGPVTPGVPIRDFTHWRIGLMLSRFLFEIDPEGFAITSRDALTEEVLRAMVPGPEADPVNPAP